MWLNRCNDDEGGDTSKYLAAFIISMVLLAFGVAPMYLLGVTYLDDASPPGPSSIHIGIMSYRGLLISAAVRHIPTPQYIERAY